MTRLAIDSELTSIGGPASMSYGNCILRNVPKADFRRIVELRNQNPPPASDGTHSKVCLDERGSRRSFEGFRRFWREAA